MYKRQVITGVLFNILDMFKAKSFAPPKCPETKLIENLLQTSTTTTAGSLSLPFKCFDIALTAIPVELINTIESYFSKHSLVISLKLKMCIRDRDNVHLNTILKTQSILSL